MLQKLRIIYKNIFQRRFLILFTQLLFIFAAIKSGLSLYAISIVTASLTMTHDDFHTNRSIGTSDEMNSTKKHGGTSKLARTSYATAISLSLLLA